MNNNSEDANTKPVRIRNLKGARRLLAKYIYDFQKGTVSDGRVKTLAYLLIKYMELTKVEKLEDLEKDVKELQEKLNDSKKH